MTDLLSLCLLGLCVLLLNAAPAFVPPTWMLLAWYGFRHPGVSPWLVALLAALCATAGRLVLALCAQHIARSRWLGARRRESLEAVAALLHKRQGSSALSFLLFACTPLPSNVLFLAYGLTQAPLWLLCLPFFVGRLLSYGLALQGGAYAADALQVHFSNAAALGYFVVTQSLMMGAVWLFTRVDWRRLLPDRWWH